MSIDKSVRKKSARLTVDEFAFIVSMGIALNTQVAGYDIPNVVVYGISVFWIVVALSRTVSTSGPLNRGLKPLGIRFVLPKMLILLYSYFLFVSGLSSSGHPGGFNQFIAVALPIASVYLYGKKTVDLVFYSCLVSFLFVVPYTCMIAGIGCLLAPIQAMFNSLAFNPFETHQFTFTAAFLSVYYLLIDCERGRGIKTIASLTMCFMGFKRIVLLAIVVVVVVHVIHSHLGKKAGAQFYSAGLFLLAVCCFVFIVLLYNGFISSWMSGHSLNVMGRNYYWQVTVDNSVFSPLYIGAGVNSLTHLFTTTYSYLHVGGVHCDILKYYFEIGFFGFLFWLGYFLVYLPAWIRKVCGAETFNVYVLITLFMFVLFFTDNVDIYYGSQLLFAAIPMVVWLKSHSSLEEGGRKWDGINIC